MATWFAIIGPLIELITMILKNKFEKDAQEKARKDDLHAKLADAIKNRDSAGITDLLSQLR